MYQKPCRLTRADKYFMGGGSAPSVPQQDLGKELAQIRHEIGPFIKTQFGVAGEYGPQFSEQDIGQSRIYGPQYAQLGLDLTRQFGGQYAQAGFDIANKQAPQYLNLNLDQMQRAIAGSPLLGSMNQQAQTGLTSAYGNLARGGVDPLLAQATTQAQQGLTLGGAISDQERRQVTQDTLAGFAARGNAAGQQALAKEFLNRDIYSRGRQLERQQYAGTVEGQRQGALGLAQSQLGQAQQFAQGTQMQNLATTQGLGGTVAPPNYAGYAQAPNLAAYGAPGASYAPMSTGIGATSGTAQGLLNFGSNLFDANQNAAATQNIAAANKSAGTTGAGIGAIGSIAGGALVAL